MQFSRIGRRFSSWMAILAVLMGTLAPTMSHALRADASEGWTEVCTLLGSKWVSGDEANDVPPPLPDAGLAHCAYCTLNTTDAALPSSPHTAPLLALRFEVRGHFLDAPRTPSARQGAQARAPPARR